MSALEHAIGEQIDRLRVLWPVLNSRQEHTQEIENAIRRKASKLTADDVTRGFDDAIEAAPTTGWPPGPHEVLGCVMARAHTREINAGPRKREWGVGLTFHEWWQTLPAHERGKHGVLHRMMTGDEPVPLKVVEEKPVPATPMPDEDEIEWEEAA